MKRHIITSLLLSLLGTMMVSGQQIARMERIDMPSRYFQHKRPVLIYTPANFDEETMTDCLPKHSNNTILLTILQSPTHS